MCDSKVKVAPLQMILFTMLHLSVCILWNFLCRSSATLLLLFVCGAKVVIVLSFPYEALVDQVMLLMTVNPKVYALRLMRGITLT